MSEPVKLGPLWKRSVIDPGRRVIKYPGKVPMLSSSVRFDDLKRLRVIEYITQIEQEQLLNLNPEVQKERRPAELWADLKDGSSVKVGEAEGAGLLLFALADAAGWLGAPIISERALVGVPTVQA